MWRTLPPLYFRTEFWGPACLFNYGNYYLINNVHFKILSVDFPIKAHFISSALHHQTRISFCSFSLFCCGCSLRAFWVFLLRQKLQQRLTSCRSVNDTLSVRLVQRFLCRCLMWGHAVIDCVPAVVCFNHRLNGESPFCPAASLLSLQSVQIKTLHTDRIAFKVQ